ncbi:trypsin-like serine protease, partial [Kitasatospora sp. NPDC001225]
MSGITARPQWKAALLTTAVVTTVLSALPTGSAGAVPGDTAADGSYTFTAHLAIGDNLRACTGTLVDRSWVLTAASCFS